MANVYDMILICAIFLCPVWAVFLFARGGKTSTRAGHTILLPDDRVIECHSVHVSISNYLNVLCTSTIKCLDEPVLWCLKYYPTWTCTWSWTCLKSLTLLERSMALPRCPVFEMYAFWAAWRKTSHCNSERHYQMMRIPGRIHLQQDKKRQGSFMRRRNIRWTVQIETILPNSPMTGW